MTPPAAEPVSLERAKDHLRVEHHFDDDAIRGYLAAARQHAETFTARAFVSQTWETALDAFPEGRSIRLARGQLRSVEAVTYWDAAGVEQTLPTNSYVVDDVSEPGRVVLADSASWPATARRPNAVRVRYVVGYGAAAAVPEPICQAILLLASHFYEHREPEITGTVVSQFDLAAEALLRPYRLGLGHP